MIKVGSVMSENVVTVNENVSLPEAAELMAKKDISCLVVVKEKKPIGIVNDNDFVKMASRRKTLRKLKVKDIVHRGYRLVTPKTHFYKVEKMLNKDKIKRFLVMKNSSLVGIVTDTDIVNAAKDFTRFHIILQEIILIIFGLATFFFLFYFSELGQAIFK